MILFIQQKIVIPGVPVLLDVNEVGEKKISLTIQNHENLRCYYSFVNGIKLQTKITYKSKWDFNEKDVRLFKFIISK